MGRFTIRVYTAYCTVALGALVGPTQLHPLVLVPFSVHLAPARGLIYCGETDDCFPPASRDPCASPRAPVHKGMATATAQWRPCQAALALCLRCYISSPPHLPPHLPQRPQPHLAPSHRRRRDAPHRSRSRACIGPVNVSDRTDGTDPVAGFN